MTALMWISILGLYLLLMWLIVDYATVAQRMEDQRRQIDEMLGLSWSRDVARRRHPSSYRERIGGHDVLDRRERP
ncbi:hypothetical protein WG936_05340 [Corynebacterium sp. H127]|uniref:hypothetical protein n=1 Tax=Corynebacterium sp. H127 TaxID=3133418 RepID=UPI0030B7D311